MTNAPCSMVQAPVKGFSWQSQVSVEECAWDACNAMLCARTGHPIWLLCISEAGWPVGLQRCCEVEGGSASRTCSCLSHRLLPRCILTIRL